MRFLNKNIFRGKEKNKNKKTDKIVFLLLEKDGEFKEIKINLRSKIRTFKKVKTLSSLNNAHWDLISTKGDPGKEKEMFDEVIAGLRPSVKDILQFVGVPGIPSFLKKYFHRGELKND